MGYKNKVRVTKLYFKCCEIVMIFSFVFFNSRRKHMLVQALYACYLFLFLKLILHRPELPKLHYQNVCIYKVEKEKNKYNKALFCPRHTVGVHGSEV